MGNGKNKDKIHSLVLFLFEYLLSVEFYLSSLWQLLFGDSVSLFGIAVCLLVSPFGSYCILWEYFSGLG